MKPMQLPYPEDDKADDHMSAVLFAELAKLVPDQVKRVMSSEECDIEPQFVGFVRTYALLAQLIPQDRIIYDMGCSYAFQSWYFRDHRGYVGVDIGKVDRRIQLPGHDHRQDSIEHFCRTQKVDPLHFAICNYVPPWHADNMKVVRERFQQCYVFYPCSLDDQKESAR